MALAFTATRRPMTKSVIVRPFDSKTARVEAELEATYSMFVTLVLMRGAKWGHRQGLSTASDMRRQRFLGQYR